MEKEITPKIQEFHFRKAERAKAKLKSKNIFIQTFSMFSPIQTARQLRQKMTAVEKVLWLHLRNYGFKKWKFRRQHPIVYKITDKRKFFYVADFYCAAEKLVVELDGKHHQFSEQKIYDQARNKIMNEMGIRTLGVQNDDFFPLHKTLEKIEAALTTPEPSPLHGEGQG